MRSTSAERIALDTNILVYTVDEDAGARHLRARTILDCAAQRAALIALQSISEFFAAATRKRLVGRAEASARAGDFLQLFEIVPALPVDAGRALAEAEAGRRSYWDALLLATLERAGCTLLLSEDMGDGARLGALTVRDPFAGPALAEDLAAALGL
jgi:predicted nucleic acid-binding protein